MESFLGEDARPGAVVIDCQANEWKPPTSRYILYIKWAPGGMDSVRNGDELGGCRSSLVGGTIVNALVACCCCLVAWSWWRWRRSMLANRQKTKRTHTESAREMKVRGCTHTLIRTWTIGLLTYPRPRPYTGQASHYRLARE